MSLRIYTRTEWGARYPNGFGPAPVPWKYNVAHHSVTAQLLPTASFAQECEQMRILEEIGQNRFGGGISYTNLIFPSGRAFEGHSVNRQGAHTANMNDVARAICFVGDYEANKPTNAQLNTAAEVLKYWKAKGYVAEAKIHYVHRQLKSTACPGQNVVDKVPEINRLASLSEGSVATPAEMWGYDHPDDQTNGRDMGQLVVDGTVAAEKAASPLYGWHYKNVEIAPEGDAFWFLRNAYAEAKKAREVAEANAAKLSEILAKLSQ